MILGEGFDKASDLLGMALKFDIISKSGAWYRYGNTRIGQGADNAKNTLKKSKKLSRLVDRKVRKAMGL